MEVTFSGSKKGNACACFEVSSLSPLRLFSMCAFGFVRLKSFFLSVFVPFETNSDGPEAQGSVRRTICSSTRSWATLIFGESDVTLRTFERLGEAIDPSRCRLPESKCFIPAPKAHEVVVFRDMFDAVLRFPLDPVIADILDHFKIRLHQLTPNAFVRLSLYMWVCKTTRIPVTPLVFNILRIIQRGN